VKIGWEIHASNRDGPEPEEILAAYHDMRRAPDERDGRLVTYKRPFWEEIWLCTKRTRFVASTT
jgi:hypothetical protein